MQDQRQRVNSPSRNLWTEDRSLPVMKYISSLNVSDNSNPRWQSQEFDSPVPKSSIPPRTSGAAKELAEIKALGNAQQVQSTRSIFEVATTSLEKENTASTRNPLSGTTLEEEMQHTYSDDRSKDLDKFHDQSAGVAFKVNLRRVNAEPALSTPTSDHIRERRERHFNIGLKRVGVEEEGQGCHDDCTQTCIDRPAYNKTGPRRFSVDQRHAQLDALNKNNDPAKWVNVMSEGNQTSLERQQNVVKNNCENPAARQGLSDRDESTYKVNLKKVSMETRENTDATKMRESIYTIGLRRVSTVPKNFEGSIEQDEPIFKVDLKKVSVDSRDPPAESEKQEELPAYKIGLKRVGSEIRATLDRGSREETAYLAGLKKVPTDSYVGKKRASIEARHQQERSSRLSEGKQTALRRASFHHLSSVKANTGRDERHQVPAKNTLDFGSETNNSLNPRVDILETTRLRNTQVNTRSQSVSHDRHQIPAKNTLDFGSETNNSLNPRVDILETTRLRNTQVNTRSQSVSRAEQELEEIRALGLTKSLASRDRSTRIRRTIDVGDRPETNTYSQRVANSTTSRPMVRRSIGYDDLEEAKRNSTASTGWRNAKEESTQGSAVTVNGAGYVASSAHQRSFAMQELDKVRALGLAKALSRKGRTDIPRDIHVDDENDSFGPRTSKEKQELNRFRALGLNTSLSRNNMVKTNHFAKPSASFTEDSESSLNTAGNWRDHSSVRGRRTVPLPDTNEDNMHSRSCRGYSSMSDVRRLAEADVQDELSTQGSFERGFLQFEVNADNNGSEETGNVVRILPTYSNDMIFLDDYSYDLAVSSDDLGSAGGFEGYGDQKVGTVIRGIQKLHVTADHKLLYSSYKKGKPKKPISKLISPLVRGEQQPKRRKDSKENFKGVKRLFLGKSKRTKMDF